MTSRIERLAKPKPNLLKHPDSRSVYWLDELPPRKRGTTTAFAMTPRLSQLAQGKRLHPSFQGIRPSPVWRVSAAALRASPSERVRHLAMPRVPAEGWHPDRPLLATVRKAVLTAVPTPHICQLSQPKKLATLPPQNAHALPAGGPQPARVSSHISILAAPKSLHPEYQADRPVLWSVPTSARRAAPSERVRVLAQPKVTMALCEDRDPYRISRAALRAVASPRVEELSAPLPRKCRPQ
ncbi:sperm microtubule associated protein 2 [Scleropages formosus]|uniref:sperm microtubule associated protein 2 n=1 Tax=Scleropages formosus TaxID=113540 RepID=UPI0008781D87|nr:testicular haploid expressed gene protein-like [Scleropages formosus]